MSNTSMYGVVLWTNTDERKAVIWCEDHGNLAFYSQNDLGEHTDQSVLDGLPLDAGDLIQFDLREERDLRLARNPQRVEPSHCPGIARKLINQAASISPREESPKRTLSQVASASVVSLADYIGKARVQAILV
ncbi:hypothetical protein [Puniceibacterium sp. IMCC21224]|uniref:hypothetical protein n=1 Tax=Puniceibacterium sp. IMCC21224 TaxID=1618204 RepID=UPI00065D5AAA|nr:hypothetical protein [Puniceibacterium sp. IMCC21224]KMK67509.1 hypothetical protein IMCC21224_112380 [Puniceibacterium sp. IMCC21224]